MRRACRLQIEIGSEVEVEILFDLGEFGGAGKVAVQLAKMCNQPHIKVGGGARGEVIHHAAIFDDGKERLVQLIEPGADSFRPFARFFSWLAVEIAEEGDVSQQPGVVAGLGQPQIDAG